MAHKRHLDQSISFCKVYPCARQTQTTLRAKCVGKSRVSLWVRAVRPNDVITKESPSTFEPVTLLQVGLMHTLWSCIYESHFQSSATVL